MTATPLKVDLTFTGRIEQSAAAAALAEERGVDGTMVNETRHDAFLQLALSATTMRRIDLASAVATAFATVSFSPEADDSLALDVLAGART